jgi:hypothetical protein
MNDDDCSWCRVSAFVEVQRREGERRGWSYERIMSGWTPELFRRSGCDYAGDRGLAESLLRAGPPIMFALDLGRVGRPLS